MTFATRRIPFTPELYHVVNTKTNEAHTGPLSWADAEYQRKLLQANADAQALEDYGVAAMMSGWVI